MKPSHKTPNNLGFTMVEILVALACAGIILIGLYQLATTAFWSYTTQDKLIDMHQNGQLAIKKLSELLMEAGSYLPGYRKNVNVVTWTAANDITLLVNPKGGTYVSPAKQTAVSNITVDSASLFQGSDTLLYVSPDTTINPINLQIASILLPCTLSLASARNFAAGDALYSVSTKRISQSGTSVCVGTDTIADNIETLRMVFLDSQRAATTTWKAMRSCSLTVVARTSVKIPHHQGDGYVRDTLRMIFSLKSKQM